MSVHAKLLEFYKAELESKEPQRMPKDLIEDVKGRVEKLTVELQEARGLQLELLKTELDRIKTIVNAIFELRRNKVATLFANGIEVNKELLTDFELEFYEGLIRADESRKLGVASLLTAPPREDQKRILVRILKDVPPFVGIDLRTYGPFRAEDVALIPIQNAEVLIKQGLATGLKEVK